MLAKMTWQLRVLVALVIITALQVPSFAQSPVDTVRTVLSAPDSELNYARAKLAFDAIIAPELDEAAVSAEIDQLANAATQIAANGSDVDKLKAAQQVIYEAGACLRSWRPVWPRPSQQAAEHLFRHASRKLCVDADFATYLSRAAGAERLAIDRPTSYIYAIHKPY